MDVIVVIVLLSLLAFGWFLGKPPGPDDVDIW
jgi:hypothetical protein